MKRKAFVLVFDGLADWEPAHALCEINKSGKFAVVTVGFSDDPGHHHGWASPSSGYHT